MNKPDAAEEPLFLDSIDDDALLPPHFTVTNGRELYGIPPLRQSHPDDECVSQELHLSMALRAFAGGADAPLLELLRHPAHRNAYRALLRSKPADERATHRTLTRDHDIVTTHRPIGEAHDLLRVIEAQEAAAAAASEALGHKDPSLPGH